MKTAIKRSSKEWNEIYFSYLIGCIESTEDINSEYDAEINDNLQERIKFVLDCFNSEVNEVNNKRRIPNLTHRIGDWFAGLPGVISIDFYNHKIIELCEGWGVLAPTDSERKQDQVIEGWFVFMAHYLLKLAKKHKIDYSYLY